MKLDRNEYPDGRGKYCVLNMREILKQESTGNIFATGADIAYAMSVLHRSGLLDQGRVGSPSEFFVIRLKDINAKAALTAYADEAEKTDPEWASEVRALAERAGPSHPLCKIPD